MATIAFGSDHAGMDLRAHLIAYLTEKGHTCIDLGSHPQGDSIDYPVFGEKVGRMVASGECGLGIAICGTGVGISLAANRVRGVRAAVCSDTFTAEMTRRHNNANVLALGARVVGPGLAEKLVDAFVDTPFEGGRHARRVAMLDEIQP